MYRPRPSNDSKLECDICGKPAKWRDNIDEISGYLKTFLLGV